jgi:hypothetical protein
MMTDRRAITSAVAIAGSVGMPLAQRVCLPYDPVGLLDETLKQQVRPTVEMRAAVTGPKDMRDASELAGARVAEVEFPHCSNKKRISLF